MVINLCYGMLNHCPKGTS